MEDERKQCGACNNLDAYWAEKARKQEAEKGLLEETIEGTTIGPRADRGSDRPAADDDKTREKAS